MLALLAAIAPALALFKCNNLEAGNQKWDLSALDYTMRVSDVVDTPPSTTNTTWYLNPCDAIAESRCPKKSQVCGIQTVELDGETLVTQVIPIAYDDSGAERGVSQAKQDGRDVLELHYTGATWGDKAVSARVQYECTKSDTQTSAQWADGKLVVRVRSKLACAQGEDPGDGSNDGGDGGNNDTKPTPKPGKGDDDASTGGGSWLWTIFLVLIVGFLVYVAGTAWANYQRFGTARVELGPISDILKDLPYLLRDFINKVTSTFGSSRGGYSAV